MMQGNKDSKLTSLDITANSIGPEGARHIAEAIKVNSMLTSLNLKRQGDKGEKKPPETDEENEEPEEVEEEDSVDKNDSTYVPTDEDEDEVHYHDNPSVKRPNSAISKRTLHQDHKRSLVKRHKTQTSLDTSATTSPVLSHLSPDFDVITQQDKVNDQLAWSALRDSRRASTSRSSPAARPLVFESSQATSSSASSSSSPLSFTHDTESFSSSSSSSSSSSLSGSSPVTSPPPTFQSPVARPPAATYSLSPLGHFITRAPTWKDRQDTGQPRTLSSRNPSTPVPPTPLSPKPEARFTCTWSHDTGSTFGTSKVVSHRTLTATATLALKPKSESGRSHNLISKMAPVSTTFQTESLFSKRQPDVDNMPTGVNAMAQRAIPETVHHHHPDHAPLACQR
eukprot:g45858.t1